MNIEDIREYCLSKKEVKEEFPFDESTLAFKVLGKIFLITNIDKVDFSINLKCNPQKAIELREAYESIIPGFHMNKKHWNTVNIDGKLPHNLIYELIDHSYELVVNGLPKNLRSMINLDAER